jgi:hypothetical protein
VAPKSEARKSHFMLLRVWESVREWTPTFPNELPLWELESRWTPKSSKSNCKVKTYWIEEFLITLEIFWNINVQNGLAWPIWLIETQVMAKKRVGNQIANLTPNH